MPYANPERRREYQRQYQRQWNQKNRERRRQIMQASDQRRKDSEERQRSHANYRHRRHIRQRVAVLERYGGCCVFCGTDQFEHLTIDHTNGDGKAHRIEFSPRYRNIYDFLYRTGLRPDRYRVLCWNCHMAMTRYGVMPGGEELRDMDYWREFGALRRRTSGPVM